MALIIQYHYNICSHEVSEKRFYQTNLPNLRDSEDTGVGRGHQLGGRGHRGQGLARDYNIYIHQFPLRGKIWRRRSLRPRGMDNGC